MYFNKFFFSYSDENSYFLGVSSFIITELILDLISSKAKFDPAGTSGDGVGSLSGEMGLVLLGFLPPTEFKVQSFLQPSRLSLFVSSHS